jgi:hypothetical protein
MATLSGNITATQRSIRVSDGAAVTPGLRVRVDDELIDFIRFEPYPYINGVRQKGLDATRWVVSRGVGDSVAASHLAGATLTAAVQASVSSETLMPPDPFVDAVGAQTISLVGPISVPFDHPDIAGNFGVVRIAELAANAVVMRFWAVMTTDFTGTVAKVSLAISDTSDGNNTTSLSELSLANDETSSSPEYSREITTGAWAALGDTVVSYIGVAGPTGAWLVALFGAGTQTAGELNVYALVGEPV